MAFEDNPITRSAAKQHVELCKTSKHFADYDDIAIEMGSVGCGHFNQFLACIHDCVEVPMAYQQILCEQGCTTLDAERLCKQQPILRTLLQKGLEVLCIRAGIEEEYPRLPSIFQKALNVEHHIGEGPNSKNSLTSENMFCSITVHLFVTFNRRK